MFKIFLRELKRPYTPIKDSNNTILKYKIVGCPNILCTVTIDLVQANISYKNGHISYLLRWAKDYGCMQSWNLAIAPCYRVQTKMHQSGILWPNFYLSAFTFADT